MRKWWCSNPFLFFKYSQISTNSVIHLQVMMAFPRCLKDIMSSHHLPLRWNVFIFFGTGSLFTIHCNDCFTISGGQSAFKIHHLSKYKQTQKSDNFHYNYYIRNIHSMAFLIHIQREASCPMLNSSGMTWHTFKSNILNFAKEFGGINFDTFLNWKDYLKALLNT